MRTTLSGREPIFASYFADRQRQVDAGLLVRPEGWPEKCHNCGAGWWYVCFDNALGFNCANCGAADADE